MTGEGRRAEAEVAFPLMIHERPVIVAARKPFNDVQDVPEATRLRTVAVNLDRLVLQRGLDKPRHDHSVLARLPRTDGIKKPHDDNRKARFLPMGESEKFIKRLCTRIRPAVFIGRTR